MDRRIRQCAGKSPATERLLRIVEPGRLAPFARTSPRWQQLAELNEKVAEVAAGRGARRVDLVTTSGFGRCGWDVALLRAAFPQATLRLILPRELHWETAEASRERVEVWALDNPRLWSDVEPDRLTLVIDAEGSSEARPVLTIPAVRPIRFRCVGDLCVGLLERFPELLSAAGGPAA